MHPRPTRRAFVRAVATLPLAAALPAVAGVAGAAGA